MSALKGAGGVVRREAEVVAAAVWGLSGTSEGFGSVVEGGVRKGGGMGW